MEYMYVVMNSSVMNLFVYFSCIVCVFFMRLSANVFGFGAI